MIEPIVNTIPVETPHVVKLADLWSGLERKYSSEFQRSSFHRCVSMAIEHAARLFYFGVSPNSTFKPYRLLLTNTSPDHYEIAVETNECHAVKIATIAYIEPPWFLRAE